MAKRDGRGGLVERFLFWIYGPASVEKPLTGNSQEARDQWKRLRENIKRQEEEKRRGRGRPDGP